MVSLPPNTEDSRFSYLLLHNKPLQHLVACNSNCFYYFPLALVLTGLSCLAFLLYMTPDLAASSVGPRVQDSQDGLFT